MGSKQKSSSSESESESSDDDGDRKKRKKKKLKSQKIRMSKQEKKLKKRIETYSPDELFDYLKEMKRKKKVLKDKAIKNVMAESTTKNKPLHKPDPSTTFPEVVNGKPSHFYCLICSVYA